MALTGAQISSGYLEPVSLPSTTTRHEAPQAAALSVVYVSIQQLSTAWKEECVNKLHKDVIHNFFKGPAFFLAYPGVQFSIGRCDRTGQHDFLMPASHLPAVQQRLQQELGFQLPAAQHLRPPLLPASFSGLKPMAITAAGDFWKELKALQKLNKQSKQAQELQRAQQVLAQAQQLARQVHPLAVFLSVDLEWWEDDDSRVLELGWSLWDPCRRRHATHHYIVRENLYTRNRKYVPDNKDWFEFGESQVAMLGQCVAALQAVIDHPGAAVGQPQAASQLVLVGHGLRQDLQQLAGLGVVLPPSAAVLDTQELHWAASARAGEARRSIGLLGLLKELRLAASRLHNAGNDARWTMEALLGLLAA